MRAAGDLVVTVHLVLDEATWHEAASVIRAQGWREEEGVRILLGYGAAVHLDPPAQDPLHALGALRAELATLRHRAFLADQSVWALGMNRAGLEASVAQARRSVVQLEREVAELRDRARRAGVAPPETPDPQEQARGQPRELSGRPEDPDPS